LSFEVGFSTFHSWVSTLWNNLIMAYEEQKIMDANRIHHVL
jgi:hypothetical protein